MVSRTEWICSSTSSTSRRVISRKSPQSPVRKFRKNYAFCLIICNRNPIHEPQILRAKLFLASNRWSQIRQNSRRRVLPRRLLDIFIRSSQAWRNFGGTYIGSKRDTCQSISLLELLFIAIIFADSVWRSINESYQKQRRNIYDYLVVASSILRSHFAMYGSPFKLPKFTYHYWHLIL